VRELAFSSFVENLATAGESLDGSGEGPLPVNCSIDFPKLPPRFANASSLRPTSQSWIDRLVQRTSAVLRDYISVGNNREDFQAAMTRASTTPTEATPANFTSGMRTRFNELTSDYLSSVCTVMKMREKLLSLRDRRPIWVSNETGAQTSSTLAVEDLEMAAEIATAALRAGFDELIAVATSVQAAADALAVQRAEEHRSEQSRNDSENALELEIDDLDAVVIILDANISAL